MISVIGIEAMDAGILKVEKDRASDESSAEMTEKSWRVLLVRLDSRAVIPSIDNHAKKT